MQKTKLFWAANGPDDQDVEEVELQTFPSFEETTAILNRINKSLYGVEPFKSEELVF